MAGYIVKIDAFDNATEDWTLYCERIEQYFKANDIDDDKRGVSVVECDRRESLCTAEKPHCSPQSLPILVLTTL